MPRKKALKVIVDIHFHAITCPGVFLPNQQDVFLNIEGLGQRKRTTSIPPVFPFLFHEKLRFEKVFSHATDPVQVASALSGETVRIELVQLNYPGGELLATYEDNAREFLFPTPRVSPTYPGVDREVLLQRASSFPGIAPKLEFSSRTIIKEVTSVSGSGGSRRRKEKIPSAEVESSARALHSYQEFNHAPVEASTPQVQPNTHSSRKKKSRSSGSASRSGRAKARSASLSRATGGSRNYEMSTIASRARSPSPYTRRRMAQLSVNDPFESAAKAKPFKTELEERPEFVVRKAAKDSLSSSKAPPPLPHMTPSPEQRNRLRTPSPRSPSYSPSRRKQTPGKHLSGPKPVLDLDSEDDSSLSATDHEASFDVAAYNARAQLLKSKARRKLNALKSAYYRPITAGCCMGLRRQNDEKDLRQYIKDKDWQLDMDLTRSPGSYAPPSRSQSEISFPLYGSREPSSTRRRKKSGGCVRFKSTTELIDSSLPLNYSRPSSARSAPESTYRTPRRDLSFSDEFDEPLTRSSKAAAPGSILYRTPLRERFSTNNEPSPYEKIRDRVRDLLRSPRATQIVGDSIAEASDRYWERKSATPSPRSPRSPRTPAGVSVRLGVDSYWNERASEYSGRSHRQVFDNSVEKIYDDIYRRHKTSKP